MPTRTEFFRRLAQENPNPSRPDCGEDGVPHLVKATRAQIEQLPSRSRQHVRALTSPDRGWLNSYYRWLIEEAAAGAPSAKLMAVAQTLVDETAIFCAQREGAEAADFNAAILAEAIAGAEQDIEAHRVRDQRTAPALERFYNATLAQIARLKHAGRIARAEIFRLRSTEKTA